MKKNLLQRMRSNGQACKPETGNLKWEIGCNGCGATDGPSNPQLSAFRFQPSGFQAAFSLVEVALALAITAFCLVAVFGLLPVGLTSNQASIEQTAAANIARSIITDLRSTPTSTTGTASSIYGINIPAAGSANTITSGQPQTLFFPGDGSFTPAVSTSGTTSRYRAAIGFAPPQTTGQKSTTVVRLLISWPALADRTSNTWPTHASGTFETVTALDRN